jgi:eukaryotic-like serine/threonine-protein kinase
MASEDDTRPAPEQALLTEEASIQERYGTVGKLGEGGMGEVMLCEDHRIGRDVAMKVVRVELRASPPHMARFLAEARIQGQLEHPSIVPVYDVGVDTAGAPYFTMKRIRGVTLRDVLRGQRAGDPALLEQYSRRRLLAAFATVCLAVHYAHTRDVLHRDLKPGNIMLGEYGEIYVLDWGVARVDGGPDATPSGLKLAPRGEGTSPGDLIGTPGYIAPEQVLGKPADARADVYALGAILFEILTLERFLVIHSPGGTPKSSPGSADARPSKRAPHRDVPPELDAICLQATANAPDERYATARALHDAIDRYLEGDRDLAKRREASEVHAQAGRAFAERASRETDGASAAASLSLALGEVSSALAFDPANTDARRVLLELLTEPPPRLPPDAEKELTDRGTAAMQRNSKPYGLLFLSWFLLVPLLVWKGCSVWYLAPQAACFAAAAASLFRSGWPPARPAKLRDALFCTSLAIASLGLMFGPLILVPTLLLGNAVGFLLEPTRGVGRTTIIGVSCAAMLLPLGLEWAGLVAPSYVLDHGRLAVASRGMPFDRWTVGILALVTTAGILMAAALFRTVADNARAAERQQILHAWRLRQLVPRHVERPAHQGT